MTTTNALAYFNAAKKVYRADPGAVQSFVG
jgi:hypothetical protein